MFTVLAGFGGGDVDERLEIGRARRRLFGLLLELGLQLRGGCVRVHRVGACGGEVGLELGRALLDQRRGGTRGIEIGSELLSAVAVLGGFGGGDVDERLEIGRGRGRLFGLVLELGLELRGGCVRVLRVGACGGEVGLELGCALLDQRRGGTRGIEIGSAAASTLTVLGGFGGGDVNDRLEVRRAGGCVVGLLLELAAESIDLGCALVVATTCLIGLALGALKRRLKLL